MTAPRLLGLRALGLGDFCCAVPAWKALRAAFPDHRTMLAAPMWQRALLELCPAIDELAAAQALRPLAAELTGCDVAVNLHGRGPESTRILAATAPARLIAFAGPSDPEGPDAPAWLDEEHEVFRWCRLVRSAGVAADPDDLDLAHPRRDPAVRRATVLHPGASAAARRWPASRWAALASRLAADGHRVVLTGSGTEGGLTASIAARAALDPRADLAGHTDVLELAALIADARVVVSGDTGAAHLASGYRTRSVVLFGPTRPSRWGPPNNGPHRVLWAGNDGDPHAATTDPGLLDITVEQVVDAVDVSCSTARIA
ncbi:MAG: glycosyl transferase, family 9 [Acidimicrobiales bacterium]|nr:glycosyl transferase, family 9 [Acidimicrobiales bacterium]